MRRKDGSCDPLIERVKAAIMHQFVPEDVVKQLFVILPLRQDNLRREHAEHQGRPDRIGAEELGFASGDGGKELTG